MKVIGLNGSPRKNWTSAQMLEHALKGAAAAGAETELIHLIDLNATGCRSCFACKRIGGKSFVLLRIAGAQQSDHLKQLFDTRTLIGGQLAFYYNTIVGPVGASVGYSNRTKEPYFYLNLGYEF